MLDLEWFAATEKNAKVSFQIFIYSNLWEKITPQFESTSQSNASVLSNTALFSGIREAAIFISVRCSILTGSSGFSADHPSI
jgi:hypothetical protein